MSNVEYNEWVPAGLLIKGLFGFVTGIIVFVSVAVLLFNSTLLMEDLLGIIFSWIMLGVLLFIFWNYRGLRIEIKDGFLTFDYGWFNKKSFLLSDLSSCKKTKTFCRFFGVGVRYGVDGSMAYTTSFANAVEITPKSGRIFVFSSRNPDEICAIINRSLNP